MDKRILKLTDEHHMNVIGPHFGGFISCSARGGPLSPTVDIQALGFSGRRSVWLRY
jgi:hypothetical protein